MTPEPQASEAELLRSRLLCTFELKAWTVGNDVGILVRQIFIVI